MADALDSGSSARKGVEVQVLSRARFKFLAGGSRFMSDSSSSSTLRSLERWLSGLKRLPAKELWA